VVQAFVLAALFMPVLDIFLSAVVVPLDDWAATNVGTNKTIAKAIPKALEERTKRLLIGTSLTSLTV